MAAAGVASDGVYSYWNALCAEYVVHVVAGIHVQLQEFVGCRRMGLLDHIGSYHVVHATDGIRA